MTHEEILKEAKLQVGTNGDMVFGFIKGIEWYQKNQVSTGEDITVKALLLAVNNLTTIVDRQRQDLEDTNAKLDIVTKKFLMR